jgi:hypothetical protein
MLYDGVAGNQPLALLEAEIRPKASGVSGEGGVRIRSCECEFEGIDNRPMLILSFFF